MAWWNPFTWGSGGSSGSSSGVGQTVTGGDSTSIQAGYSGPSYGPTTTTITSSTPQVGSLNPSTPSTGGSSGGGSSGSSGGSSGGGSSGSSGGSSGGTTAQQMINAVNTAQQTIQQQSQQSTGPNLPSTQSLSAQSLGLGVAGTQQPASISGVYGSPLSSPYYKETAGRGIGATLGAIGRNVGVFFTGRDMNFEKVPNPFRFSTQKRDTIIPGMVRTGTLQEGQSSFITYGEVAREQEMKLDIEILGKILSAERDIAIEEGKIYDTLQTSVSRGDMSVEDATKIYQGAVGEVASARGSQFQTEVAPLLEKKGSIYGDLFTRPAEQQFETAIGFAKAGVTIGAFAVSPGLGVGLLTAEGITKLTTPASRDEAFTESLFSARASLGGKEFSSPLQTQFETTRREGGFALAAAGISAVQLPFAAAREVTQARIEAGLDAKTITSTRPLTYTDGRAGGISITQARTRNFEAFQKIEFGIQPSGPQTFVTGTGKTTIRVQDFLKQIQQQPSTWISRTESFSLSGELGSATFRGFGTKGLTLTTPTSEITASVLKRGVITRGDTLQQVKAMGSIQKPLGETGYTLTSTGRISQLKVDGSQFTARFVPKDVGIIKPSFTTPSSSFGEFSSFGGGPVSTITQQRFTGVDSLTASVLKGSRFNLPSITKPISAPPITSLEKPITLPKTEQVLQPLIIQMQFQSSVSKARQLQIPLVSQTTKGSSRTQSFAPLATIPSIDQRQMPSQRVDTNLRLATSTKQVFSPSLAVTPFIGFGPTGFGGFGGIGLPSVPSLPSLSFSSMSGKGFRSRGPQRYTASLGAILKGVKAPKITRSIKFAEATGFLARPVVGGSRKRTSGKKRKK